MPQMDRHANIEHRLGSPPNPLRQLGDETTLTRRLDQGVMGGILTLEAFLDQFPEIVSASAINMACERHADS